MDQAVAVGIPRLDALRQLISRTPQPALRDTVRSIIYGMEIGSSLTAVFSSQAAVLRTQFAFEAERRAALAPLKLLFPLLFIIYPTIFISHFVPLALQCSASNTF